MKTSVIAVISSGTLALSGCSGVTGSATPTVTVTVTVTATPSSQPSSNPASSQPAELTPSPEVDTPGTPVETSVKYVGKSISGGARADEFFELRPTFTNVGTKKIVAIQGEMVLTDSFGTEVYSGSWKVTGLRIDPGKRHTQKDFGYIVEGSTNSPGCAGGLASYRGQEGLCRAAADKFKDYAWSFTPEKVKFGDGSFWAE